nr:transposon TX1 [Tanacetum cinerariifolium]
MLAERVKKVVVNVVGDVQNAFIKGRVWSEMVQVGGGMFTLVLNVNSCNGSPTEEFGLERGVRQGDPLSPFLFNLAAKGLNAITSEAVERGILVIVSHLQYADDNIFFGELNKENAKSLTCILKCFEEVFGLRILYNKSKLYGIGVNDSKLEDMARWMGCGFGEFPFTYLGLLIGENMRRVNAWKPIIKKFKNRLAEWKAKTMSFGGRQTLGGGRKYEEGGVWRDKIKIGEELDGLGIEFSSSFEGVVGNGRDIRFWIDRDKWRWTLNGDGNFSAKDLSRLVEEKILDVERGGQETIWNKSVPKKVNIFVWRVLKGRIPVHEELDKRGIDLDSVICPCCDSVVESCAHSLVLCDLARGVWEKIFSWWKVGNVNAFTVDKLFSANGGVVVPSLSFRFWQAVIWTTWYYLWKERNARVFGKKISSVNKIVQDIQLKSFEWIARRTKNKEF